MLTSFQLEGFRRYTALDLNELGYLNFILGNNNVGKTSILEAIYTWACGQNIYPMLNIPLARGRYGNIQQPYWMMEEIVSLFNSKVDLPFRMKLSGMHNGKEICFTHTVQPSELLMEYDTSYKKIFGQPIPKINTETQQSTPVISQGINGLIQFTQSITIAKWDIEFDGKTSSEIISLPLSIVSKEKSYMIAKYIDMLAHTSIAEIAQMYSALKREHLLEKVAAEMNRIFPEITGFDMIPYPDGTPAPVSVILKDGSYRPLYSFGDGLQRWFYIVGAITLYKNSIICIDEIDTGFHPSSQIEFCKELVIYGRQNNVQLFVTTHNIEFIDHFLAACEQEGQNFSPDTKIITIKDVYDKPSVRTISVGESLKARNLYRMDLR